MLARLLQDLCEHLQNIKRVAGCNMQIFGECPVSEKVMFSFCENSYVPILKMTTSALTFLHDGL